MTGMTPVVHWWHSFIVTPSGGYSTLWQTAILRAHVFRSSWRLPEKDKEAWWWSCRILTGGENFGVGWVGGTCQFVTPVLRLDAGAILRACDAFGAPCLHRKRSATKLCECGWLTAGDLTFPPRLQRFTSSSKQQKPLIHWQIAKWWSRKDPICGFVPESFKRLAGGCLVSLVGVEHLWDT